MPRGISIHIGVERPRGGCCASSRVDCARGHVEMMSNIAETMGFQVREKLLNSRASIEAVEDALVAAKRDLVAGDILLLTFAGHGCRVLRQCSERDCLDESWCLDDGALLDDEVHRLLSKFSAGVRILVVSESCHSETIIEPPRIEAEPRCGGPDTGSNKIARTAEEAERIAGPRIWLTESADRIGAHLLLLAACREMELAEDGNPLGLFGRKLVEVWDEGRFPQGYLEFIAEICKRVSADNPDQHPTWAYAGPFNAAFVAQRPFTI